MSKTLAESIEGLGRVPNPKEASDRTMRGVVIGEGLLLGIGEEVGESGMANKETKSGEFSVRGESGMSNISRKSSISRSVGETDIIW